MKYRTLGNTNLNVSVICLGTMTYGQQNTEKEGHEQMNFALSQGVNFFDTAEMYSVPGRPETQGSTEKIIGTWFQKYGKRQAVVLATKVTGPSPGLKYISPNLGFSKKRILEALEGSLLRLKTDYIDLYQMHWPERKANFFGQLGYTQHDDQWEDNFLEAITTMDQLIKDGKIRHWGLSNETPWGVMRTLNIAQKEGLPRPVSIQNPYNLLNRSYEVGMAEVSARENVGLLAYSPMAFGMLSGKYHNHTDQASDRINQFKQLSRYNSPQSHEATSRYIQIAEEANISPAQLSLAFVNERFFVTSNIIGATSLAQLAENISSIDVHLSREIMDAIDIVHKEISNPAP
ncbi:MAG: aldo/keto reductase [Saprospiraceae bacterium]